MNLRAINQENLIKLFLANSRKKITINKFFVDTLNLEPSLKLKLSINNSFNIIYS